MKLNLFNLFKKDNRKRVYTRIDEETIKRDEMVRDQQKKIMTLESQLAKRFAKDKERADKEKERDKESEFNKKLNEQAEELKTRKLGKIIKFGKFYKHFFSNKKFRNKLEITDKND